MIELNVGTEISEYIRSSGTQIVKRLENQIIYYN
jgi:hypothetical protein